MRPLRQEESDILHALLQFVPADAQPPVDDDLRVVDLLDGGMGSIRFTDGQSSNQKMGRELVTAHCVDADEIPVILSINLDEAGRLFEIDIWKVDFSPLIRYPNPAYLKQGNPGAPPSRS
jgi:hypothetical protein